MLILATADQFTSGMVSISFASSSGIDRVMFFIFVPCVLCVGTVYIFYGVLLKGCVEGKCF